MPEDGFAIGDNHRDAAEPAGSRGAPAATNLAMTELSVTEYEHFVSFRAKTATGEQILLQYARDQVWLDQFGVWQVRPAARPFYLWRMAPVTQAQGAISPAISLALAEARAD